MSFELRQYQAAFYSDIVSAFNEYLSVLAVLPTGGGKTVVFSHAAAHHDGNWAAVAHRKEIIAQISVALARFGLYHRIVAPSDVVAMIRRKHHKAVGASFVDQRSPNLVGSAQTLASKSSANNADLQRTIAAVSLCIFDEGHHYVKKGTWAKVVGLFKDAGAKLLFITATPERADGTGLGLEDGGFAETMVEGPTTQWLIRNGFLSRFEYKAPEVKGFDVEGMIVDKNGEFNARALRERAIESSIVGDAVMHYQQFGRDRQAILFAPDLDTARDMEVAFNYAGIPAKALNGTTDAPIRERAIEDFAAYKIRVLINVDLFDEGFDVPAAEVAIMARPTMSLGKYLQMCGRVLRIKEGKDCATIIDMVRNWERAGGPPNLPRRWSLHGSAAGDGGGKKDTLPQHTCKACTTVYPAFMDKCPVCGTVFEPAERTSVEAVSGALVDLDVDALEALFHKQEEAELDAQAFEDQLIAKNVPPIGRPRLVEAHEAAKHQRGVLRNLVGWWVGSLEQIGFSMREIHKIFYFRFDIDIGSAFTLTVSETDSLIDKIRDNFEKDLNYEPEFERF